MSPSEPVTISFTYSVDADAKYFEPLAQEFSERYPHVTVELRPRERGASGGIDASSVDVFVSSPYGVRGLREQGDVLSLDPFIERDGSFDLSDFYPGTLELFTAEGKVWAIPSGMDIVVMYYNRDLFDQYGVSYPEVRWTWEDFLDKAIGIRDPDADVFGYLTLGDFDASLFVYQHDGRIFDSLQKPTYPTFDDPLTVEALEWYADLLHRYDVAPTPDQMRESFGDERAFDEGVRSGRAGMWMGTFSERGGAVRSRGREREEWDIDWGMVPLPRDTRFVTQAWSRGYAISSHTQHPEVCWQWVRFLSERVTIHRMAPPRRSLVGSDAYEEAVGGDAAAVVRESMEGAMILDSAAFDEFEDVEEVFEQAVERVVDGDITPRRAMEQAQREAETMIEMEP